MENMKGEGGGRRQPGEFFQLWSECEEKKLRKETGGLGDEGGNWRCLTVKALTESHSWIEQRLCNPGYWREILGRAA